MLAKILKELGFKRVANKMWTGRAETKAKVSQAVLTINKGEMVSKFSVPVLIAYYQNYGLGETYRWMGLYDYA